MKSDSKIILLYTCVTIGIILIAFVLFSFFVSYRIDSIYGQYSTVDIQTLKSIRKDVLIQIAWISVLFICVSGIPAYFISKRYAKRISERIDRAYESEKSFIRYASHEVNNPLTAIEGVCEISLMKERTPIEYQNALRRIASETKRMILLMKHLLFLAHGEKEMLGNNTEPIQLANYLMEYAQGRVHFSMDNFALTINANPQLLKMAFDNIISNACKYSEGPVYMDLRGTVLKIIDNGIGIPEDELENIYQPIYRASNTREFSGNGVGLSLAIRIFQFYGARVAIHSKVNEGTTVSIDFYHR